MQRAPGPSSADVAASRFGLSPLLRRYKHQDVSGRPFKLMTAEIDDASKILEWSEPLQLGQESKDQYPIHLKHKFGETITTTCGIRIVGTEAVRIITVNMKLTDQAKAAIFTGAHPGF